MDTDNYDYFTEDIVIDGEKMPVDFKIRTGKSYSPTDLYVAYEHGEKDDEDEAIERAEKKFFEENPNPSEDLEFQTYKIHHSYQEEDD